MRIRAQPQRPQAWSLLMDTTQMMAVLIAGGGALGVFVWVLAKVGKALIKIAEALVAAAAVFFALWLVIKAVLWALRQTLTHWRTSLTVVGVLAWWHWWGWPSLTLSLGLVAGVLTGWRLLDLVSFDAWAARYLRAWWLRWTVYSAKLPDWLHACGLGISSSRAGTFERRRSGDRRGRRERRARLVRSGGRGSRRRGALAKGRERGFE